MSNRRFMGIAASVLVFAVGAMAWFIGCSANVGLGGAGLHLSSGKLNPSQFLTISHDSIKKGLPVQVEFRGPGEFVVTIESYDVEDGSVRVAVPAFVDFANGTIGPGEVTVSIRGIAGQAALHINDLPPLDGVEPGAILALFLRSAIEDYQKTIDNLILIEAEFGPNETADHRDALNEQIQQLQATLAELETTGQLVVNMEGIGVATLTADWLRLGDRLLVSMLAGFDEVNGAASKGSVSFRTVDECICGPRCPEECPPNPPPNPPRCPPPGVDLTTCMGQVVDTWRESLHKNGVKWAGYLAMGVGLGTSGLIIAGTIPLTGTVGITGLTIGILGGVSKFADAGLQGKNTDNFIQNNGGEFNPGQEALSQTARVLTLGASIGFKPLENALSTTATSVHLGVKGMDFYNGHKCSEQSEQQKRRPLQVCTDVCAFCTLVRPPGCDNSCTLAFDGLCDDGGPGSFDGICALGTDCIDCGPRGDDGGVTDGGGEGVGCTNTCEFANDGTCDDGGTGSSFDICLLGTDCADCGARDVSVCSDTCSDPGDGICDDGGPGASFAICELGTDCTDCGPRSGTQLPGEVTGACCLEDGTCADGAQANCLGTYQGDGTFCSNISCAQPGGPFAISGVNAPGTCSDCPGQDLTVIWTGNPVFPVTLRYQIQPGKCPFNVDCSTPTAQFAQEANPLVFEGAIFCTGLFEALTFEYEVVMSDARSVESAPFPAPFTCEPAPTNP